LTPTVARANLMECARRGVLVVSLVILIGVSEVTGMAAAARPAKTSEMMQMSSFQPPKSANGFLLEGLISTRNARYGMVLLTPKPLDNAVTASNPMYAYLFRKPLRPRVRHWTLVARRHGSRAPASVRVANPVLPPVCHLLVNARSLLEVNESKVFVASSAKKRSPFLARRSPNRVPAPFGLPEASIIAAAICHHPRKGHDPEVDQLPTQIQRCAQMAAHPRFRISVLNGARHHTQFQPIARPSSLQLDRLP
jgi:hypothetical protein